MVVIPAQKMPAFPDMAVQGAGKDVVMSLVGIGFQTPVAGGLTSFMSQFFNCALGDEMECQGTPKLVHLGTSETVPL